MITVISHEGFRMLRALFALVAFGLGSAALAADDKPDLKPESVVGTKAPGVTLPALDGTATKLDSLRGKAATVVVFTSFECPVANSYAAELNELAKTHAEKGVRVVLVCATDEPLADVAKAAATAKPAMPVLHDAKKELARALKAQATPEVFLLDGDGVVRYRGRIDNAYSKRLVRNAQITSFDLKDALAAVLAGKPVAVACTPPVGCPIDLDPRPVVKAGAVTFHRDVAPILNKHCVVCHRAGEVAPFPLTSYKQAVKWASDIKEYTAAKQRPPWSAAGGVPIRGERKMTDKEIATLAAWADADAPEGDPKHAPPAPDFVNDGWRLGKPDLVLESPEDFRLGGSGNDLFRVFVLPTGLTEDKWIVGYDVKPGNPRVVHHTLHFFDATGQARELENKQQEKDRGKLLMDSGPGYTVGMGVGFVAQPPKFGGVGGWAPGVAPQYLPDGAGWLIPKGADFLIQTHYHRNGQFATDRTKIGLYFAKGPIDKPWQSVVINGLKQWQKIPAGKADYQTGGAVYLHNDAVLHNVLPHMHLLGKSVTVTMTPPGGKPQVLIDIPAWDYRWQETYWFAEPIVAKAGTKLEVKAVYDNSESNPNNPTRPPRDVSYGEETTDEMCFIFFGMTSPEKPSKRIKTYAFPPAGAGEAPIAGEMTPLLKDLVGSWDTTTQVKVGVLPVSLKGLSEVRPVYDGKFVRIVGTTSADDRGLVQLVTYDAAAKEYRMWLYDASGLDVPFRGSYDEKTKTLAWKSETGDALNITQNWKFADAGGYTWDMVISRGGKTVREVKGDNTKKKAKE